MEIYSARELEGKEIERSQMIVENLLPVGLTVLAGSPKLGKSWLALSLCCAVANGTDFLQRPVAQGNVLYCDLEGTPFRTQERLSQLEYGFPDFLQIAHSASKLNDGLLEELEYWWSCSSLPRLIVIDTIVKVRGSVKKSGNAYEIDSDLFSPLQKFALEKQIAVVCVTHLRKSNAFLGAETDWLERITGSMGLTGISDNVWGLFRKRGDTTAFLRTSSRDVDAGDLVLSFDNGNWRFVSDDLDTYEFHGMPIIKFINSINHVQGTASELCARYLTFCKDNQLPHGLSETQPANSFGKLVKKVQPELWRIRKSVHISKARDGKHYWISSI